LFGHILKRSFIWQLLFVMFKGAYAVIYMNFVYEKRTNLLNI